MVSLPHWKVIGPKYFEEEKKLNYSGRVIGPKYVEKSMQHEMGESFTLCIDITLTSSNSSKISEEKT